MGKINIAVCVKPVPDPQYYDRVGIDPVKKTIMRNAVPTIINPVDKNAVEAALQIKESVGGTVTLFSMAPPMAEPEIRKMLAMGADEAYLISDRAFAGSDTLATSYIISSAIRHVSQKDGKQFDLVLCGSESADGATSQVSSQIGEWLSLPHLWNVFALSCDGSTFRVKTKIENGYSEWEGKLPAVLGVSYDINKPRFTPVMSIMKAKHKPYTILTFKDMPEIDEAYIGLKGSPTKAGELFEPHNGRSGQFLDGSVDEKVKGIIATLVAHGIAVREK